jgi:hypothetical protein
MSMTVQIVAKASYQSAVINRPAYEKMRRPPERALLGYGVRTISL